MSEPKTIEHDTWLYHHRGERLFLAGSEHPGEGWFDHPQAKAEKPTATEAVTGGSAIGSLSRVAELERDLDEQKTKFDTAWGELTKSKKAVEDENADLRRDLTSRDEDIRQLKEQIAKFDPDGDGKVGGGAAKTSITAKPAK